MKKVFTHDNRLIVFHIRNLLQDEGVTCQIKNEYAGGGVGDLAPFETWPEIWVDEDMVSQALQLIAEYSQEEPPTPDWVCKTCGEHNDGRFQICWNCSGTRQ